MRVRDRCAGTTGGVPVPPPAPRAARNRAHAVAPHAPQSLPGRKCACASAACPHRQRGPSTTASRLVAPAATVPVSTAITVPLAAPPGAHPLRNRGALRSG